MRSQERKTEPTYGTLVTSAVLFLLLIGTLSSAGAAVETVDLAADRSANASDVTPEEALEARAQAISQLRELERLADRQYITIAPSTTQTIQRRIENGNLSYERARYETAHNHFQVAREQARAALIRNYREGASARLNATSTYLSDRRERGYTSVELTSYEEQVQQLKQQDPRGLQAHEERYDAAENLHREVKSELPPLYAVRLAKLLSPWWVAIIAGTGLLLIYGSVVGYLGYRRGRPDDSESTGSQTGRQGADQGRDVTTSRFNND